MSKLSNNIRDHYIQHFETLPFDKQLHFSSRLALWSQDSFCEKKLAELQPQVTANGNPRLAIREVYKFALQSAGHGSKNAAVLRAPYFSAYPNIKPMVSVLFRIMFLWTIFHIDEREYFFELFPKEDAETLYRQLLADSTALAILSTHAINFLYLYTRLIIGDEQAFDPSHFIAIAHKQYDLQNPIHLQLYIYLYTHCIIGESWFYAQPIPATYFAVYKDMLQELENVMADNFTAINMDNKFEFLVCCRLLGIHSSLESRIYDEAEQSVSSTGTFIIDRHNSNPQKANLDLDSSEHRNVLFIMSQSSPLFDSNREVAQYTP
ncbi:MAG: hypothetical protein QG629_105 [Patescibacteria group bacterium]|nr:hypothetical protein [Candidatus Saccharibacteria bacterium]MDQ5963023.1 hypothetical protein [Patescibacteria group bacterium]